MVIIILIYLLAKSRSTENIYIADINKDQKDFVKLVRVIDGDTIEVKIGEKIESVRLIGIDAPEMDEDTKEKAIESKKYLEALLEMQKIYLESDETQNDRDIYNRLLRYVFLEDKTFINRKMIEANMAEEYTFIVPYKYQEEFRKLNPVERRN